MTERLGNDFLKLIERGVPLSQLQERLKPGNASEVGFIGKEEYLPHLIHNDWTIVTMYETSHSAIANAIRNIFPKFNSDTREEDYPKVDLHPDYEYVKAKGGTLGNQRCPWDCHDSGQGEGIIALKSLTEDEKSAAEVLSSGMTWEFINHATQQMRNEKTKIIMFNAFNFLRERQKDQPVFIPLTGLLTHLIETHHFFEGKESPFRADPELLIKVLMLEGKK